MNYSFNEARPALEVFHTGDSVHAYNLLGAHLVNWNDRNGCVFRVWAPTAKSVSVAGEFNNWDNEATFMYDIGYGVWEVFVEGVEEFCAYKYCIESEYGDKLMKADPYAFHAQTRPGQASLVYDIENYSWNDGEWLNKRKGNNISSSPMNIYEIHAGSWRKYPDGNFFNYQKLADELIPYLKEMHYTHIQLMPIMEYPYDGSWGFQTTSYYAPTSRYGTPSDFMTFVDRLHCEGIGVILDWVPSNFPVDDFGLAKFDGSPLYESNDPKTSKRDSWGTCLFNYARFEVTSFLVSCAMFWLDKYHIDGLRIGALSSMLYLDYGKTEGEWEPNKFGGKENLDAVDFVKRLNTAVHMYHPDVMMFAEENTSWPKLTHKIEDGGLGFDFKWNMGWMNDMLSYISLDPLWRNYHHDTLTFSMVYAFSENFMLPISHDEVVYGKGSLINKMPGDYDMKFSGVRGFIAYMMAHPGKKLMFMGSEIGQFDEWNANEELEWNLLSYEKHRQLNLFFAEANKFYRDVPAMHENDYDWDGFQWIALDDYKNSIISFRRIAYDGSEIICVCNFQPVQHDNYVVGVPEYGIYEEVFNSEAEEFGGCGIRNEGELKAKKKKDHELNYSMEITVPPLAVMYFKLKKKLALPVKKKTTAKKDAALAKLKAEKAKKATKAAPKKVEKAETTTKKVEKKVETAPKKTVKKAVKEEAPAPAEVEKKAEKAEKTVKTEKVEKVVKTEKAEKAEPAVKAESKTVKAEKPAEKKTTAKK